MTRSDDQRIADILDACDELSEVAALRESDGANGKVLLRAAERLLEIMGEAASNVTEATAAAHADVDWRSIARLRIILAHHYHRSDPELVWSYAIEQTPRLAAALRT